MTLCGINYAWACAGIHQDRAIELPSRGAEAEHLEKGELPLAARLCRHLVWQQLSCATLALQAEAIQYLLWNGSLQNKTHFQVGDTVSGLAERIYDDSDWPELLPFLFECVQSNQPRQMESALRIFADLASFIMPILLPHVNVLRQQLQTCMSHPETDVKIAGLSATTCFIRDIEEDSDRNKFQDLIPVMLQTVSNILSTEEQDSAEEALEAFIEIAENNPTFLRRQLDVVVNNMLQVRHRHLL